MFEQLDVVSPRSLRLKSNSKLFTKPFQWAVYGFQPAQEEGARRHLLLMLRISMNIDVKIGEL